MRPLYMAVRNESNPDLLQLLSCSIGNCPKKASKCTELNRRSIKVKLLGPYVEGQEIENRATKNGILLQEFTCIKGDDGTYSIIGCKDDKWVAARHIATLKNAQIGCMYKAIDLLGYSIEYVVVRKMEELYEFSSYQRDIKSNGE